MCFVMLKYYCYSVLYNVNLHILTITHNFISIYTRIQISRNNNKQYGGKDWKANKA